MNKKEVDLRRHYILAIDTETAGSIEQPLVYDFGCRVIDTKGKVYEEMSAVIYEIYCKEKEKMKSAYYADKLPQYEEGLKQKEWKIMRIRTIFFIIRDWMRKYNISEVMAYNTAFDRRALNHTLRYCTQEEMKWFFPYGTEYLDIWNMACSTLYQRKSYYKMALAMNWESEKGNVLTNAEVGYSYVNNEQFEERHTALEDVKIETEIYFACKKAKVKPDDRKIINNPWRKPQKGWKTYKVKHNKG